MTVDIDLLVATLNLEEVNLLAGADFWSTRSVDWLGLPAMRVTDGPSGARGGSLPGALGPPSTCIPCGSATGATWNVEWDEQLGRLVGTEASPS